LKLPEGKTVKNRLHLDVSPTDREQNKEVRRLLDLGARHAYVGQTGDESWVSLADPDGNEFCVLADRRA
jgi:Glyoxalase-like domain